MTETPAAYGSVTELPVHLLPEIAMEYAFAKNKHRDPYNSLHEGYGFMLEEFDELWDAIKKDAHLMHVETEIRQIVVVALRILELCERKRAEAGL